MVYINSDGTIGNRPFYKNISGFFAGIVNFVYFFFWSLVSPGTNLGSDQNGTSYRRPGDPPQPPKRRMGGIARLTTCDVPMAGGG